MSKREYPRLENGVILNGPAAEPAPQADEPINVNESDLAALRKIKGVGKATAGDIIAAREADGPFESLEDCADRVGGVSLEQLEAADAIAGGEE